MTLLVSHLPDELKVDEEITLRAKSSDTFELFAEVAKENREHLFDWMPWAENTPDESSVEHYRLAPEKKKANESSDWDIFYNGKMVGAIGILIRDSQDPVLEIGYWLAKDSVGKGIVTKSCIALRDLSFKTTEIPFMEIACDAANLKSQAIAIRAGFSLNREVERKFANGRARLETETGQFYRLTREGWSDIFS